MTQPSALTPAHALLHIHSSHPLLYLSGFLSHHNVSACFNCFSSIVSLNSEREDSPRYLLLLQEFVLFTISVGFNVLLQTLGPGDPLLSCRLPYIALFQSLEGNSWRGSLCCHLVLLRQHSTKIILLIRCDAPPKPRTHEAEARGSP